MSTNYKAMVSTANEKYTQLIERICQLTSENEKDRSELLNLAKSIYNDEVDLIVSLYDLDKFVRELNTKTEILVPDFMKKK